MLRLRPRDEADEGTPEDVLPWHDKTGDNVTRVDGHDVNTNDRPDMTRCGATKRTPR